MTKVSSQFLRGKSSPLLPQIGSFAEHLGSIFIQISSQGLKRQIRSEMAVLCVFSEIRWLRRGVARRFYLGLLSLISNLEGDRSKHVSSAEYDENDQTCLVLALPCGYAPVTVLLSQNCSLKNYSMVYSRHE